MRGPSDAFDEDSALLVAFAAGDPEAARLLLARLGPRAYAQAFRMLSDTAEAQDVTQEALVRLWKIAPEWRQGEAKVSTWLYRVIANLCTDRLRKRVFAPLEEGEETADTSPSALAQILEKTRRTALSAALARLPERQAQAVALRHLEGLSLPQIAQIMETTLEASESLIARGKAALTEALAEHRSALGFEDE